MRVFYHGCIREAGHFLWKSDDWQEYNPPADFPVPEGALDSYFLPPKLPQTEGRAVVWASAKWTILAFWDRSVDTRGGCNSAFIIEGRHDFDSAVAAAKSAFPKVWARFKFAVVEDI